MYLFTSLYSRNQHSIVKKMKKKKGESHSVMSDSFATPWTVAHHAPLPVGFSRQEYWSGLPFLPPGDLLNPGMEPTSPMSPALQVDSFTH